MVWKKKLPHSTRISAIVSPKITSISIPPPRASSIFTSGSLFSSLSSLALCRLQQTRISSIFPNLSTILARQNAAVKDGNFFSSLAEKLRCWNCGIEADDTTSFLFCQACRSVQPVNESID